MIEAAIEATFMLFVIWAFVGSLVCCIRLCSHIENRWLGLFVALLPIFVLLWISLFLGFLGKA